MSSEMIQIIVLAVIALFLVLRLRSVLGTRSGYEKPEGRSTARPELPVRPKPVLDQVEHAIDEDIAAHVKRDSPAYGGFARLKAAEPDFTVEEFLAGARQAYEMIVMGYESGDLDGLQGLISPEVQEGFAKAIAARRSAGLIVEARFIGVREAQITEARFDERSRIAEITLRFVGELASVVRNARGEIVEGDPSAIRRQTDIFTFERRVGSPDPNWVLVSTGE
ncbi:MAG TPA: Tim44/TimA family putative adaptor protein [Paracoccaceae bacterium]|nr:Tim44/TimA family putative adaptor protein [Paracoccaceae bacterium]